MATCKRCGAETQLYSHGVPLCVACSNGLTAKAKASSDVPNEVNLGLPHEPFADQ